VARTKSIYRRLTPRYRRVTGYSQLWIAPDHILLLKSSRFSETYQRFSFSDIQAIVVTELPDSQVAHFVVLLAALLWTALAATVSSRFGQGFFLVTGAWFIALAIVNVVRGQRCRCYLHTAVSRVLLEPVRRVRVARALLDRVRPEIEKAQGVLPAPSEESSQPPLAVSPVEQPPEVPRPRGFVMEVLFGLLLLDALVIPVSQRFPLIGSQLTALMMSAFFAELALAVFILIWRARNDPRRAASALVAVALVCMLADLVWLGRGFVTWFQLLVEVAQRQQATPPPFTAALSPGWLYFAFGWRMVAGLAGLAAARFGGPARASARVSS
jgi:hypothetical protein